MSVRITEAELLEALAEGAHGDDPEDARTMRQLREDTGFSDERILRALHTARTQGRLMVHNVWRETLLGRRTRVPAYTITPRPLPSTNGPRRPARKRAG